MRPKLICLAVLVGNSVLPGCPEILEAHSVDKLKATVSKSRTVRIRGFLGNSSETCIEKPIVKKTGSTLTFQLKLTWLKKGQRCLDYELALPPGIERIVFGERKTAIWPDPYPVISYADQPAYETALSDLRKENEVNLDDIARSISAHDSGITIVSFYDYGSAKSYNYTVDADQKRILEKRKISTDLKLTSSCKPIVITVP